MYADITESYHVISMKSVLDGGYKYFFCQPNFHNGKTHEIQLEFPLHYREAENRIEMVTTLKHLFSVLCSFSKLECCVGFCIFLQSSSTGWIITQFNLCIIWFLTQWNITNRKANPRSKCPPVNVIWLRLPMPRFEIFWDLGIFSVCF